MFAKLRRIYIKETRFDWTVFAANMVGGSIVALAFTQARASGVDAIVQMAHAGF